MSCRIGLAIAVVAAVFAATGSGATGSAAIGTAAKRSAPTARAATHSVPACATRALVITVATNGAGGKVLIFVGLRNRGRRACAVRGRASLALRDADTHAVLHVYGNPYTRTVRSSLRRGPNTLFNQIISKIKSLAAPKSDEGGSMLGRSDAARSNAPTLAGPALVAAIPKLMFATRARGKFTVPRTSFCKTTVLVVTDKTLPTYRSPFCMSTWSAAIEPGTIAKQSAAQTKTACSSRGNEALVSAFSARLRGFVFIHAPYGQFLLRASLTGAAC